MSIGYACLQVGVAGLSLKSVMQKNATPQKLQELIEHNLDTLLAMLRYNVENDIHMFRISSDIIPFGSSPVNTLAWTDLFAEKLAEIGQMAMQHNIRLSMHPGQYTVLNSPDEDVARRAVEDLAYHTAFLDALGLSPAHKIILHIGGVYGNKPAAIHRFIANYHTLAPSIKARLIIENDDKLYTIEDVLQVSHIAHIPVVFDNLHHAINHVPNNPGELHWLAECKKTWGPADGPQKMHYSQQAADKKRGSHSATIAIGEFMAFYTALQREDIDIMLEVKDKNLSAIKCILCTQPRCSIQKLEQEWARYKYTVLEQAPNIYQQIRTLLKDKTACPSVAFYKLVEQAQSHPPDVGAQLNGLQHVWGYFKQVATDKEKQTFQAALQRFTEGRASLQSLKRQLYRLAVKYDQTYLLGAYYFSLEY